MISPDLFSRLCAIHEKMRSVVDEFEKGKPFPPLFCYALDNAFLDKETYDELEGLEDKGFIAEPRKLRQCRYAILLYLVRSFYKNADGKNWRQAAMIEGADSKRPDIVKALQSLIFEEEQPWNYGEGRKKADEAGRYIAAWMKTQCLALKAEDGGESSVVIDVNTAFYRLLVEKGVNLLNRQGDWMQLARMNSEELEELRREKNLVTQHLKDDFEASIRKIAKVRRKNPRHAVTVWQHSRFEWMLALEALDSDRSEVPERVYEKWPWLKSLVELKTGGKVRRPVLNAHWMLYRDGLSYRLYLTLPQEERRRAKALRITQGERRIELAMPRHVLGYEVGKLCREHHINLFGADELLLELVTEDKERPTCTLPTMASNHGCMVFRHTNMDKPTARLNPIALHTLVQTPHLKLIVLHRFARNEAELALFREREREAVNTIPLPCDDKAEGLDCFCSAVELDNFRHHVARVHDIRLKQRRDAGDATLFYALWKPQIEFHPQPQEKIWVKDNGAWNVIEENRDNVELLYLKVDGVDHLTPPSEARLRGEPPMDIMQPEEGSALGAYKVPPFVPLKFTAGRLNESEQASRTKLRHMAEAVAFYLPRQWRELATPLPDDERWEAARRREVHHVVQPEQEGAGAYRLCEPLAQLEWRWVNDEGSLPIGRALAMESGWQRHRLQLAVPAGHEVFVRLGNVTHRINEYLMAYASKEGIEAGKLIGVLFPHTNPADEVELSLCCGPKGSRPEQQFTFLRGRLTQSGEFARHKAADGSEGLYLCMLPEERGNHCLHILHETALFDPKGELNERVLPCASLRWDEHQLCRINELFESSREPNGIYRLWLESCDDDDDEEEDSIPLPAHLRIATFRDGPGVAWFEKGSQDLFNRIRRAPARYGHCRMETLRADIRKPNFPHDDAKCPLLGKEKAYLATPLFTSDAMLAKLRAAAEHYKPVYM